MVPGINLTLGFDSAQVCLYDNVLLSASGGDFYSWSPATDLSDSSIATPTCIPNFLGPVTYTVTVTDINDCSAQGSVYLEGFPNVIWADYQHSINDSLVGFQGTAYPNAPMDSSMMWDFAFPPSLSKSCMTKSTGR